MIKEELKINLQKLILPTNCTDVKLDEMIYVNGELIWIG